MAISYFLTHQMQSSCRSSSPKKNHARVLLKWQWAKLCP
jgi:hypothetical protein